VQHDLDHFGVRVASNRISSNVGVGDLAARLDDLDREPDGRRGPIVGGAAVAIGGNLGITQARQVLADERMRRRAVAAAIELGDGQRDAFAGSGIERALAECAAEPEVARAPPGSRPAGGTGSGRCRACLDADEQRLGGGGGSFDGSGNVDA
jgi:hypothetical protein